MCTCEGGAVVLYCVLEEGMGERGRKRIGVEEGLRGEG